ncbi:hypothetical protein [Candidatus Entotheonella palauensis]|uniref:Uncharacterized protein n=1 Tax=Candidatus Entotheonella gemina TaxID=1429439 RepID=W4LIK3_9BACT|nr:hypothetical protein [Candidatus Entotheonella palauensis]ETW97171.1 MAG: hypothetical protein ETSY2_45105 [Candidatus Entotheonella gemina]
MAGTPNPQAAPKPQYFNDPAVDTLYQMVLVLAEEVFTLREKLDAMVTLHDQGRPATSAELDALDTDAMFEARRQVFVERLLEPLNELIRRESTDT